MSETIEVVSVGSDLYQEIEQVVSALYAVQSDFVFRLPAAVNRNALRGYDQREYEPASAVRQLAEYWKGRLKSAPVAVIGVVKAPIAGNLFGFHAREETAPPLRASLITISAFERYSPSMHLFLSFFLVKFALQGLDQAFKNHPDFRKCMFDERRDKKELLPLFDDPGLCSECNSKLQPSLKDENGINYDAILALWDAIRKASAATRVSVLIMKGGGVKGLALAGALSVLTKSEYQRYYAPSTFVGTSAGAIVASMLAAGMSSSELETELGRDFAKFLDPWCKVLLNLWQGGLHSGSPIVQWLHGLLIGKFPATRTPDDRVLMSEVRERELRLIVFAANRTGTVIFDSASAGTDEITTAVRASMSLPFFFTTVFHADKETFDGGLLNNYPVEIFLRENPEFDGEFLALYLANSDEKPSRFKAGRLLSMLLARDDILTVRRYKENTIVIDCAPVGTTDFAMSAAEKKLLWDRGREAALRKVIELGWDGTEGTQKEQQALATQLASDTAAVSESRRRAARKRRATIGLVVVAAATFAAFLWTVGLAWLVVVLFLAAFLVCRWWARPSA